MSEQQRGRGPLGDSAASAMDEIAKPRVTEQMREVVDRAAGRIHSRDGQVMKTLEEVLRLAEAEFRTAADGEVAAARADERRRVLGEICAIAGDLDRLRQLAVNAGAGLDRPMSVAWARSLLRELAAIGGPLDQPARAVPEDGWGFTAADEYAMAEVIAAARLSGMVTGTVRFARAVLGAGYRRVEPPSPCWELRGEFTEGMP